MGAADDSGVKARAARRFESFADLVGRWAAPPGPAEEVEKESRRILDRFRGLSPRRGEDFWDFAERMSMAAGEFAQGSEAVAAERSSKRRIGQAVASGFKGFAAGYPMALALGAAAALGGTRDDLGSDMIGSLPRSKSISEALAWVGKAEAVGSKGLYEELEAFNASMRLPRTRRGGLGRRALELTGDALAPLAALAAVGAAAALAPALGAGLALARERSRARLPAETSRLARAAQKKIAEAAGSKNAGQALDGIDLLALALFSEYRTEEGSGGDWEKVSLARARAGAALRARAFEAAALSGAESDAESLAKRAWSGWLDKPGTIDALMESWESEASLALFGAPMEGRRFSSETPSLRVLAAEAASAWLSAAEARSPSSGRSARQSLSERLFRISDGRSEGPLGPKELARRAELAGSIRDAGESWPRAAGFALGSMLDDLPDGWLDKDSARESGAASRLLAKLASSFEKSGGGAAAAFAGAEEALEQKSSAFSRMKEGWIADAQAIWSKESASELEKEMAPAQPSATRARSL